MKKKLVVFFESVKPFSNASSVRADYFLRALVTSKEFSSVIVVTGTQNPSPLDGVTFYSLKSEKNPTKGSFIKRAISELSLGIKAILKFRKFNQSEYIFFVSSPSYLGSILIALFLKITQRNYVYEVRDLYPEAYNYADLLSCSNPGYKILKTLTNSIYDGASLIVSATAGLSNSISCFTDKKVITIYNGYPSYLRSKPAEKFEKFTVVFHGTLGIFQNIEMICKVAEKFKKNQLIEFLVIGQGRKADLIMDYVSSHQNMTYMKSMDHDDVLDIVSKCHLGISLRLDDPLTKISFPVKNWEYLGLSIPSIISPSDSEAANFLSDKNCGISVDNDDVEKAVNIIKQLQVDSHLYQNMVNCCNAVNQEYTREMLSKRLVEELISVAEKAH